MRFVTGSGAPAEDIGEVEVTLLEPVMAGDVLEVGFDVVAVERGDVTDVVEMGSLRLNWLENCFSSPTLVLFSLTSFPLTSGSASEAGGLSRGISGNKHVIIVDKSRPHLTCAKSNRTTRQI